MKNKDYAKFGRGGWGGGVANKVPYGRCASGILLASLMRASTLLSTIAELGRKGKREGDWGERFFSLSPSPSPYPSLLCACHAG